MKKITLLFLCFTLHCFSQNYIEPLKKQSFASNHHTNRDIVFFSATDASLNTIVTATTERDSTFTDLLTIKLDTDLNEVWRKRFSFNNKLSYDTPLATFLDDGNNIYAVAKSYDNSYSPGDTDLFIVKYDPNGNLLWNVAFAPCSYKYSILDDNGQLHIVYEKISDDYTQVNWHFVTISPDGQITEDFIKNDIVDTSNDNISGIWYKFYYKENYFYAVYQRHNYTTTNIGVYEHFIKKINAAGMVTYPLNTYLDATDASLFYKEELNIDANNNTYLTYPLESTNKFRIIKLNASGSLVFTHTSPASYDTDVLKSFINNSGHICILGNSKLTASSSPKTLNLVEYGDDGIVTGNTSVPSTFTDAVKTYPDGAILAYTNGSFTLFNAQLGNPVAFTPFYNEITDFNKTDDSHIVVASTSYAKMYPESDNYAQLDVVVQKNNTTQVTNTYNYSGEGTSKAFKQKLIFDNNNNYIVASEEKMGEEDWSVIGGSSAPSKKMIYKYDTNLNLLWSVEVPDYIISNLTPFDRNFVVDANNNLYINSMVNGTEYKLIKISENGTILYNVPSYPAENIYLNQNNDISVVTIDYIDYSNSDFNSVIYTLSSGNGALVNTQTIQNATFVDSYKNGTDCYLYLYDGRNTLASKKMLIYKNSVLQSSVNLNVSGQNDTAGTYSLHTNGTLYFSTFSWPLTQKVGKLTLDGTLTFADDDIETTALTSFTNGKIITTHTSGKVNVYTQDLALYSSNTPGVATEAGTSMVGVGNYMSVGTANIFGDDDGNSNVKVLDENAQVITEFKIQGSLSPGLYASADANNNLIVTGDFGNLIYNEFTYAWARGFIHKYDVLSQITLDTETYATTGNFVKIYPNPSDSFINITASNNVTVNKTEIYDLTGKLLHSSADERIDISAFSPSVYIVKIYTSNGVESGRIIKK